jgi:hypothetical protein
MIRIETIWLAFRASDLRGGIDELLAQVARGFAIRAQAHNAYVFANRRARAHARRVQFREDQKLGHELRDRAPEALALRFPSFAKRAPWAPNWAKVPDDGFIIAGPSPNLPPS